MGFINGENREQTIIFPDKIDDYVANMQTLPQITKQ
jgi:hypothetical protein